MEGGAVDSERADSTANFGNRKLDAQTRKYSLYRLADICTTITRQVRRHDIQLSWSVTRFVGDGLTASPIDPVQIQRCVGHPNGFDDIYELITIVTGGVPVFAAATRVDPNRALQYANNRSYLEHLPLIYDNARRRRQA